DLAIETARKALEINPNEASAKLVLGSAYLNKSDAKNARKYIEEYLKQFPNGEVGLHRMGLVCLLEKNQGAAEKAFEAALKANPGFADSLAVLVNLYLAKKNPENAIARLNQQI